MTLRSGLEGKSAALVAHPCPLAEAITRALEAGGASVRRLAPAESDAAARVTFADADGTDVLVAVPTVSIPPREAGDASELDWDASVGGEARGLWLAVKDAALRMREHGSGSIVVVIPELALAGVRGTSAAAAAAGALQAVTRALAIEFAPTVRMNIVAYGCIEGDPYGDWFIAGDPQRMAKLEGSLTLLGRVGSVDEVARAAVFLASDRSSFVNGHTLVVDGGYLVR